MWAVGEEERKMKNESTKTLFEGYICQLSNQIVCGEDYCSRGEEKKWIDERNFFKNTFL